MTTTSRPSGALAAVRLRPSDLAALASVGLRTRKLRATLSALGIAIGVAAVVAVLGLAASNRATVLNEIGQLGTNLLTVTPGQDFSGNTIELNEAAPGMIRRLPGVTAVQDTGTVSGVYAYKTPNIMVISVLERRSEIGLRRALGATRGQIRTQFLAEAVLLSLAGGVIGVIAGAAATIIFAHTHQEPAVIPPQAWAGGLAAAVIIGALAGLLPALRAARMSPTEALRTA